MFLFHGFGLAEETYELMHSDVANGVPETGVFGEMAPVKQHTLQIEVVCKVEVEVRLRQIS